MTALEVGQVDTDGAGNGGGTGSDNSGGWLRRRRWWILASLVVLASVVAGAVVLLSGDDDGNDDDPSESEDRGLPTPPSTIGGEIDAQGEEFLDLLAAGQELTYHATYTAEGDPDIIGTALRVDVWRRDGIVRQDLRQETESATFESASLLLADDEAIACQRLDEGDWTCAHQAPGDEFTAGGTFGNIVRELEGLDVEVSDEEIGDRQARCFTLTTPTGEVSQCMSEDGIPLRRTGDGTTLVLSELSDDVPDRIFTPPAEPISQQ